MSRIYTQEINTGVLALNERVFSHEVIVKSKRIQFHNAETYEILRSEDHDGIIRIHTDADYIFTKENNGNIVDSIFIDGNNNQIATERLIPYKSQYGGQGEFFRWASSIIPTLPKIFDMLHFLCCTLLAACITCIVSLIKKKYNMIMAVCFYIVFWLSPWIVSFSRNLYWVEFTWFIPMLIGLYVSLHIERKIVRITGYIATFITIFIKCLCGYEYISTIMVSLMIFLFSDFVVYIKRDTKKARLYFNTMTVLGVCAVLGFVAALLLHAQIRGEGNIVEGIKSIWNYDVLRRTLGNTDNFITTDTNINKSLNISIFATILIYFTFTTDIIYGVEAIWFPVIVIISVAILIYDLIIREKINVEELTIFIISFLATLSWFVLGKSHSYLHQHMNYVLWYFGFVQMCIYIPVNRVMEYITNVKKGKNAGKNLGCRGIFS